MPNRRDPPRLEQELDRLERPGGEGVALEAGGVARPILVHVGAQRNERARREAVCRRSRSSWREPFPSGCDTRNVRHRSSMIPVRGRCNLPALVLLHPGRLSPRGCGGRLRRCGRRPRWRRAGRRCDAPNAARRGCPAVRVSPGASPAPRGRRSAGRRQARGRRSVRARRRRCRRSSARR